MNRRGNPKLLTDATLAQDFLNFPVLLFFWTYGEDGRKSCLPIAWELEVATIIDLASR